MGQSVAPQWIKLLTREILFTDSQRRQVEKLAKISAIFARGPYQIFLRRTVETESAVY